jgi:undecaprenyl-diphosphatase
MSILQALILGIVQGLTEFIPVSSSGHLVLLHEWLGVTENGLAFDVALHFGTLMALLIYFHKDLFKLARAIFIKSEQTRLAWLLLAATIPAVIGGVLLEDLAESTFRSSTLVACNLILVGFLIIGAEAYARRQKHKTKLNDTTAKQALSVGLAQAVAIIPGVSRSGATITTGIFMGLDRVSATRFSFLLGVPIMFGAITKVMLDGGITQVQNETGIFAVGVLSAFISGLFAIGFMLKYLAKHSLNIFAYYRIVLGVLVLLLALA